MNGNDRRNIERIVGFADDLAATIRERAITPETIQSDQFVQWALTTPLYNIGEYASHVSKELREQHPEIPWSKVAGLRHRLVHDYEGTDWSVVNEVIFSDLGAFADRLRALLDDDPSEMDE